LQIGTPAYDSEQRESAEAASRPVEPGGQVHLAKPASRGLGPQPPWPGDARSARRTRDGHRANRYRL